MEKIGTNKKQSKDSFRATIFCFICILFVVFYAPIENLNFFGSTYTDELFATIMIIIAIYQLIFKKLYLYRFEKNIIIMFLLMLVLGLIPYLNYPKPNIYKAAFYDIVVFYKSIAIYFSTRVVLRNWDISRWNNQIVFCFSLLVIIIGLLTVINQFFDFFQHDGIRFGLKGEQLFFGHPSRLAFFYQFSFVVLLPFFINKNRIFLIVILLLGFTSIRYKYVAFMLIGFIPVILPRFSLNFSFNRIGNIVVILISFIILFFITADQVKKHYTFDTYARAALQKKSFIIANEKFPFGSGFGTYGCFASGKFYSPLYYHLGLNNIYGLTPISPRFVADTYWPMVIGQFGYIGLFLNVFIVCLFLKHLYSEFKREPKPEIKFFYISAIILLLGLIIDSSSDAIFTQSRALISFFYISIVVNIKKPSIFQENNIEQNNSRAYVQKRI